MAKTKGFHTGQGDRVAHINFAEGHRLHGIEMDVKLRVPVGAIMAAMGGDISGALQPFVKRIISWNLEDDDGNPVPISLKSFGENFDMQESQDLVGAWAEAVAQPSGPLDGASKSGSTSASG